jgi:phosphoribosylamine-glycine ligase
VVASKSGYLLTVTGFGKDIKDAREKMLEYIKENIYISDMKYRQDLGKSVEQYY